MIRRVVLAWVVLAWVVGFAAIVSVCTENADGLTRMGRFQRWCRRKRAGMNADFGFDRRRDAHMSLQDYVDPPEIVPAPFREIILESFRDLWETIRHAFRWAPRASRWPDLSPPHREVVTTTLTRDHEGRIVGIDRAGADADPGRRGDDPLDHGTPHPVDPRMRAAIENGIARARTGAEGAARAEASGVDPGQRNLDQIMDEDGLLPPLYPDGPARRAGAAFGGYDEDGPQPGHSGWSAVTRSPHDAPKGIVSRHRPSLPGPGWVSRDFEATLKCVNHQCFLNDKAGKCSSPSSVEIDGSGRCGIYLKQMLAVGVVK